MKFLRRTSNRYSKLGRKRKKKQVWRKPKGRDNKMREKRRGYPAVVKIGYKKKKKSQIVIIRNLKEIEKVEENQAVIIGSVGKKKKIEIIKKAEEKKLKILNKPKKPLIEKSEKDKKDSKEKPKEEKK